MAFNFVEYFRRIATSLKDIAHIPATPKFHRVSGVMALEEFLQNQIITNPVDGFQLIVEDNHDSRFVYNSATLLDEQYYVFYVLKRCDVNDFDAIEAAKSGAKQVSKKILSKLFRDKHTDTINQSKHGLKVFDKGSVRNQTIGPLADQYWGVLCSFILSDKPGIEYNPDDWTD